jgi:hypothetical protein
MEIEKLLIIQESELRRLNLENHNRSRPHRFRGQLFSVDKIFGVESKAAIHSGFGRL